jgi:hypothetical protein
MSNAVSAYNGARMALKISGCANSWLLSGFAPKLSTCTTLMPLNVLLTEGYVKEMSQHVPPET